MDNSNNDVENMNRIIQYLISTMNNNIYPSNEENRYYYDVQNPIDFSQIEIPYIEYEDHEINEDLSYTMFSDSEDSIFELDEVEPITPLNSPTTNMNRSNEIMYQNDIEIQTEDNGIGIFIGNINMNIPIPSTRGIQYNNIHTEEESLGPLDINNDFRSRLISSFFPSTLEQEEDELSNVLNESLYQDTSRYKKVVSEDGKKDLKNKTFFLDEFQEQTSCPITQDEFEEGQIVIELPCHHIFEHDSIMKWLDTHSHKCPVCRHELDSKEVEQDNVIDEEEENNTQENENSAIEQMVQFLLSGEIMNNDYLQQTIWESIVDD